MSLWDRIDEESKGPLEALWEALPGGLSGIPDIVARRAAMSASRAAARRNAKSAQVQAVRSAAGLSDAIVNDNGLRGRGKRNADVSGAKHKRYSKKNKRGTAD